MTELQIALAAIGALAVIALLVFNRLQERKYRKQAESALARPIEDVLLKAAQDGRDAAPSPLRIEPVLREEPPPPQVEEAPAPPPPAPPPAPPPEAERESPPSETAAPEPVIEAPAPPCAPQDQAIEYRIRVLGGSILASAFSEAMSRSKNLSKPVRWRGLPLGSQMWEDLKAWSDRHYRQIVVSLQLADRNGSAEETELGTLLTLVNEVAKALNLRVQSDDAAEALERARQLDMFCVDVDVLIGLNVVARGEESLPLAAVRREVTAAGLSLAADGTFQLLDNRGEILFSLCNQESTPFHPDNFDSLQTRGVTLLFDVPRVADGLRVFDLMVGLGRKLAHESGGMLVDDNIRPLTEAGIEKIRRQLTQIYAKMDAKGLPSGSSQALRIFS